jgi:hypothetical protein
LQHQDGHSHLLAAAIPNLLAYDPAYAYELVVIIQDGLRRMFTEQEPIWYYLTMYNETYPQPAMPERAAEGIVKGMYRLPGLKAETETSTPQAQLLGSGPLLREVLRAREILAEQFDVAADVWSVTSYKELRRDALAVARWNLLHPEQEPRVSHVQQCLEPTEGPVVAVSDYLRLVPEQIFQNGPAVADQAHISRIAEPDAGPIAVDPDAAGLAGFGQEFDVGETAADDDQRITATHDILRDRRAQQTNPAGTVGVIVGHDGLSQQGLGDGGPRDFR